MTRRTRFLTLGLLALLCVVAAGSIPAAAGGQTYAVTVTNLTRGQILSPPVVASHDRDFRLFMGGQPASPELAALAEDADADDLITALWADPSVFHVNQGEGGIVPGASATIEIEVSGRYRLISLASMLVTTNDAFMAVRGVRVHGSGTVSRTALAYDAGSEANNESCDYIPGPPCGNPFAHPAADAEGFVHVHAGVHGGASLVPAMHDWRNPVASISIRRIDDDGSDDDSSGSSDDDSSH